jgi:hypothetical protein
MVVGFTATYAISAYHDWCCEFEYRSGRGAQYHVIVCQWLATGRWFSPGSPVSSTNNTDRHDITEILLKVALNIMTSSYKRAYRVVTFLHKYSLYSNNIFWSLYWISSWVDLSLRKVWRLQKGYQNVMIYYLLYMVECKE